MKKKLEKELNELAVQILKMRDESDIIKLQAEAKRIYEKLTIMRFLETNFEDKEIKISRKEAFGRLGEKMDVPEENPNNEDLINHPLMDTIKDMVTEMPKEESLEDILKDILPTPIFVKNDAAELTPDRQDIVTENKPRSINDSFKKGLAIGLNDKVAFIKHLFDGKTEAYEQIIVQINEKSSLEDATIHIQGRIKPQFNSWQGKEEYENRFMEIVESKFS